MSGIFFVLADSAETIDVNFEVSHWTWLATACFLVILNGFFVAAEFALVKVRISQIDKISVNSGIIKMA